MERYPVVIRGAGPVGLTLSILLSREGIPHLLVERRARVSELPRARGVMSRSGEIWAALGLFDELSAVSLPPEWNHHFLYLRTLAGEVIGRMDSNCMAPGAVDAITPYGFRCGAQDRIDSMLWREAERHGEAMLSFSTELVAATQAEEAVTVRLRDESGAERDVSADWLVAADGGRSPLREAARIASTGPTDLATYLNTHFDADLSRWTVDRKGPLMWSLDPGRFGTFQALDGGTRWMCQISIDPAREPVADWTAERVVRRLRDMIGDPAAEDVAIDLHSFYAYSIAACVADRLRDRRLFLIGDAAHRIPPAGGFGMNTGIQTAHNLAWKLAAAIRGEAGDALLDSFDAERRQVAWRAADYGRLNVGYVRDIALAPAAEKPAAIARSRQFGNWAGLDLGVHYDGAGAFVPDDSPPPAVADPVVDYVPTAKPGYRAPHIWVTDAGGRRLSTIDLTHGGFTLFAGADGRAWTEAAGRMSPVVAGFVVGDAGDLRPEGDFETLYGIEADGAVLVRPDGHVAYRSRTGSADPTVVLRSALDRVLARDPVVPRRGELEADMEGALR